MTSTAPQEKRRPRLIWAFRRGAADYYDRLGLTVLASLILTLPAAAAFSAGPLLRGTMGPAWASGIVLLVLAYGTSIAWGMNVALAHAIAFYEDPSPETLRSFFRKLGWPAARLATLQILVSAVMFADAWFFLSRPSLAPKLAGMVLAYLLLLWVLMMLWQWPFLVHDGGLVAKSVKKAALVLLDNPFYTLGAFFVTMTAGALLAVSMIGVPAALGGLLSCFVVRAHRELLIKYEIVEDDPDVVDDAGWPRSPEPPRRLNPRRWGEHPENRKS